MYFKVRFTNTTRCWDVGTLCVDSFRQWNQKSADIRVILPCGPPPNMKKYYKNNSQILYRYTAIPPPGKINPRSLPQRCLLPQPCFFCCHYHTTIAATLTLVHWVCRYHTVNAVADDHVVLARTEQSSGYLRLTMPKLCSVEAQRNTGRRISKYFRGSMASGFIIFSVYPENRFLFVNSTPVSHRLLSHDI